MLLRGVHGIDSPQIVVIERAEQDIFDDDATVAGGGHESFQPLEVGVVPASEIELVAAVGGALGFGAGPRGDVLVGLRRQRVVLDFERAGDFSIGAGERSREVKPACSQFIEVGNDVEVGIQDGPVVLG